MPVVKLPFGEVLTESFGFFFTRLRLFFHLVTIPWILSIAIRIVGSTLAQESLVAVLVEKAADVIPTVMFMVAWQRVVLLGPRPGDRLPGLGWSSRETAYLVHLIKVAGITFVLVSALMLTVGSLDPGTIGVGAPLDPELARLQTHGGAADHRVHRLDAAGAPRQLRPGRHRGRCAVLAAPLLGP